MTRIATAIDILVMLGDDVVDVVFHYDLYRTKPELAAWIKDHRQMLADVLGKHRPWQTSLPVHSLG